VKVDLSEAELSAYALPNPSAGPSISSGIAWSLKFLEVAPHRISARLLSAAYLAPLCEVLLASKDPGLKTKRVTIRGHKTRVMHMLVDSIEVKDSPGSMPPSPFENIADPALNKALFCNSPEADEE